MCNLIEPIRQVQSSTGQPVQLVAHSGALLDRRLTAVEALQQEVARKAPEEDDARRAAPDKDSGQDEYQSKARREERKGDCCDDGKKETREEGDGKDGQRENDKEENGEACEGCLEGEKHLPLSDGSDESDDATMQLTAGLTASLGFCTAKARTWSYSSARRFGGNTASVVDWAFVATLPATF